MAHAGQKVPAETGGAQGGARQQNPPIDSRIIEALIRAVYWYDSYILKYDWIAGELESLVEGEDEHKVLEEQLYERLANGEIKNVSIIYGLGDATDRMVVAVAPCVLTEEQWNILVDLADLYDYAGYEDPSGFRHDFVVKPDRPSLDFVMHNLIRAWCMLRPADDNARAVYEMFKTAYGLEKSFSEIVEGSDDA